jgi:hypothetical protein
MVVEVVALILPQLIQVILVDRVEVPLIHLVHHLQNVEVQVILLQ